ncbi:MAG: TVP38/TMEM64 family protein [Prochlorothrix sp.]|nr:TVP38/TMEM64 family protein [Prochlorothrix sp.]
MFNVRLSSKVCQRLVSFHASFFASLFATVLTALPLLAQDADPGVGTTLIQSIQGALVHALATIQDLGPLGPIAFIALYIIATVAFLPGSIVTLGAGVVFGVAAGSVYVFVGATLGAIAAFLVGRYLARGWVEGKISGDPNFSAIDRAVGREGLKIVILTRLSPLFPFNLLNYAYGLTGVSLRDYAIGSVGMLPGTIMYVYLGDAAGSLATLGTGTGEKTQAEQILFLVGLGATVAVTLYVTAIAKKALAASVQEEPNADATPADSPGDGPELPDR